MRPVSSRCRKSHPVSFLAVDLGLEDQRVVGVTVTADLTHVAEVLEDLEDVSQDRCCQRLAPIGREQSSLVRARLVPQ